MKKLWSLLLAAIMLASLGISTAEAKRLGGGSSFGKQSQSANRQSLPPAQNQAAKPNSPTAPGATPPKPASPWKGILGGALLGLGLGALLSHLGIGGALAGMIGTILTIALIGLVLMFIFRLFSRKQEQARPAFAGATSSGFSTPEIGSRLESGQPAALQGTPMGSVNTASGVPDGFDTPGFLRQAKTNFIRMQAAWDRGDVSDIREFTTPEAFAELRLQMQESGASKHHTDVVSLDADLLGIETHADEYLASVRFSGMIKEAEHASAEPFSEVWNLAKPVNGQTGWLLAGIQQVQ
ncbi:MAG: Tim44 domain-containing protein [Burkholderiales bacterium]|nr:Tim44 domain-containing protein [Burkholderiales bacterium]